MHTISKHSKDQAVINKKALQALGVLIPIKLSPLKFLPGRHPLGRSGSGLRFLRTRPYIPGEDNPRDIDKFSPPDERMVIEWEQEAQSKITLLADVSSSMGVPFKSALRNASLMQLTYSLWRAGDHVRTIFFSSELHQQIKAANLKKQMELLTEALSGVFSHDSTDIFSVLKKYMRQEIKQESELLFVVSDFVSMNKTEFSFDSDWRHMLNQIRHRLIPVIITFKIPLGVRGMLKVWDPERQSRSLTWFSSTRINQINREEDERLALLTSTFRSAGLDYLVISNQREVYPQLAQLARNRRGRKN